MDSREQKALEIAAKAKLTRKGNTWIVPSQAGPKKYTVDPDPESPHCTCPDFEFRQARCKHIFAVEYTIKREQSSDGQTIVTESVRVTQKTYTQDWPAYNKAQANERAHFLSFLYELCSGIEEPVQTFGRPRLPLSDIIFSATFRTYSTVSGRRFVSELREALAKGYLSKMPSYNSIFDYLKMESLTSYLKHLIAESAMPLKPIETSFAVDSSGFSTTRFVRWFDVKYGNNEDWHDWIKMHITCGVTTHIVTSVELSSARMHDSPYFKPLIESTAKAGFTMKEIVADKGYISKDNLQTAVDHGATPYIPFKTNTTGKGNELWKKLFHYYSFNREEFLTHYHKRSNVETTFSMIKAKFGERLRCKTETAQVNEALCKVLCHNLCVVIQSMYELGVEPQFRVEAA
ncbi:MAG TPA: transposase [Pyrinomonadaceae bacterium]|nr:transposase [Pyrinomonadaceae bacterium]